MYRIKSLEYDSLFNAPFSPKPEVLHLKKTFVNITGKPQQTKIVNKETEKQETENKKVEVKKVLETEEKPTLPDVIVNNTELATLEELRNVTPKKLFRRKK